MDNYYITFGKDSPLNEYALRIEAPDINGALKAAKDSLKGWDNIYTKYEFSLLQKSNCKPFVIIRSSLNALDIIPL